MLVENSNKTVIKSPNRPPDPVSEKIPAKARLIDVAQYDRLWQTADDIERRFLHLAFKLEIADDGWTVDGYTLTELHSLMQYPPSSISRPKLKAIIEKYASESIIRTHPPRGHRRRFWFSFVLTAASDRISQRQFNVILDHNDEDRGSHFKDAAKNTPESSIGDFIVIQDHIHYDPGSPQIGSRITMADTHEEEDSITTTSPTGDQLLLAHKRVIERLQKIGINGTALEKAKTMPAADLETILENVEAGEALDQVRSKEGLISYNILNNGANNRAYIIALKKRRQVEAAAVEQQRELEALGTSESQDTDLPAIPEIIQGSRDLALEEERGIRASMRTDCLTLPRQGKSTSYQDCWTGCLYQLEHLKNWTIFTNAFAGSKVIGLLDADRRYLVVETKDFYFKERAANQFCGIAEEELHNVSGETLGIKFVSPESKTALDESAVLSFAPAPLQAAGF